MTPTHAVKKGTRYRYYVSRRLMVGTANKSVCDGQRIPGANLEDLIIGRVRTFVANPLALLKAVSKGRFGAPLQKKLKEAAEDLLRSWDNEPSRAVRRRCLRVPTHYPHSRAYPCGPDRSRSRCKPRRGVPAPRRPRRCLDAIARP